MISFISKFGLGFLSVVLTVAILAVPELAAAQGLVTCSGIDCNWCSFVQMVNGIVRWLVAIAVLIAVLILAYAGFRMVVSAGDVSAVQEAKKFMLNTVIGLIIILAAWTLVDTLIKALAGGDLGVWNPAGEDCGKMFDPNNVGVAGYNSHDEIRAGIIADNPTVVDTYVGPTGTAEHIEFIKRCSAKNGEPVMVDQNGSEFTIECRTAETTTTGVVTAACSPLSPITDSLAQQMENGSKVIWTNTDSRLRTCVNKFIGAVGGSVTSAYRPQAYQAHLYEVSTKACQLSKISGSCEYAAEINAEREKHGLRLCGAVAQNSSRHTSGTGVDISGINHSATAATARQYCLEWKNYTNDPYHYDLISGCSC